MKREILKIDSMWALLGLVVFLLSATAFSVPYELYYSGRMTTSVGAPVEGPLSIDVNFFRTEVGGTEIAVDISTFTNVTLDEGVFTISIELSPSDFHTVFSDSAPVWIEIKDVTNNRVYPRQVISSVPYALKVPVDNDTIVYNSDGKLTVGSGGGGTVRQITAGSGLTGGTITNSGTITVDTGTTGNQIVQLSDGKLPSVDGSNLSSVNAEKLQTRSVSAAVPVTGQVLKWSGSAWVPSSDLVGAPESGEANTASNVTSGAGVGLFKAKVSADLQFYSLAPGAGVTINLVGDDVVVASTITQYTDAMAKATAVGDAITDAITDKAPSQNAVFDALALKSAASHNHSGVYEPAGLSTDVVTTTKILNGAVTSAKIANLGVDTANINTGAVTAAKIAACSDTQILKMSGANWVCSSDAINSGGTVTSVASGTGLTGGPITGSGTISLATSGVTPGIYTKVTVDTFGRATSGTSIAAGDLPASIDAAKIGSGAVSNTEFGYLDGVTSAIQTQLNGQVAGPASATDNAIARFDGTTGKLVQNSSMMIDDSGNVGIGTTNPTQKLQLGSSGDGSVAIANAWNTFSDIRLKRDLVKISDALDKLLELNGYYFYWKKGGDQGRQVGVIAQEVEEVLPELVKTGSDGIKTVDYPKITAVLIEATKKIKADGDQLKVENLQLKADSTQLKADSTEKDAAIEQLKTDNDAMKAVLCEIRPEASFCGE